MMRDTANQEARQRVSKYYKRKGYSLRAAKTMADNELSDHRRSEKLRNNTRTYTGSDSVAKTGEGPNAVTEAPIGPGEAEAAILRAIRAGESNPASDGEEHTLIPDDDVLDHPEPDADEGETRLTSRVQKWCDQFLSGPVRVQWRDLRFREHCRLCIVYFQTANDESKFRARYGAFPEHELRGLLRSFGGPPLVADLLSIRDALASSRARTRKDDLRQLAQIAAYWGEYEKSPHLKAETAKRFPELAKRRKTKGPHRELLLLLKTVFGDLIPDSTRWRKAILFLSRSGSSDQEFFGIAEKHGGVRNIADAYDAAYPEELTANAGRRTASPVQRIRKTLTKVRAEIEVAVPDLSPDERAALEASLESLIAAVRNADEVDSSTSRRFHRQE